MNDPQFSDEATPLYSRGISQALKAVKIPYSPCLPIESYRRVGFDDSRDEVVARKSASAPIIDHRLQNVPRFQVGFGTTSMEIDCDLRLSTGEAELRGSKISR